MSVPRVPQFLGELADREAIRDCLYRYSRGADRCDEEMLRSAYWADAFDDHAIFSGSREELIAWVIPTLRAMDQTMHMISNILIRLDGDHADVESYFYGYHRIPDGRSFRDAVSSGRYVDRFERRDAEWRILRRQVVVDWFREYPDSGDWEKGPHGQRVKPGGRYPTDISYSAIRIA
jgi:hypothetical protein